MLGWLRDAGLPELDAFLTSAAIGLLIGAERERRAVARAGLRTFALIAVFGVTVAMLAERAGTPWLVAVGLLIVGAMMIAAYTIDPPPDEPGTTTIIAAVVCYCLAVLVWHGGAALALMAGVGVTVLLYFKAELRGLALGLERPELVSILQLAVLTFVVLPLLPDRGYGPSGAVNPRQVWQMVVLIAAIGLAGYMALKVVGARHGTILLGLFGGLASSTATTLVYARLAGSNAAAVPLAALVVVIANVVVPVRIALVVAVTAPSLLPTLGPPLAAAALAGCAGALLLWHRRPESFDAPVPPMKNPAAVGSALVFGLVFALVLSATAWLGSEFGTAGLYGMAFLSGLTDVDAITLSSLRLRDLGGSPDAVAATAILVALSANVAFKLGTTLFAGGFRLAVRCAGPMLAGIAGLWLAHGVMLTRA